jgi:hypothetical protein
VARPVATADTVRVEGLDELRRELRKLDDAGLSDRLKDANYRVADVVVRRAQQRASALGRMQTKAAGTLRPARQAARAVVTLGRASVPFALGAEFGAGRGIRDPGRNRGRLGLNQFSPWRGSGRGAGYFLWPGIRDSKNEIESTYYDEIDRITSDAFPD